MKKFLVLFSVIFLTACGASTVVQNVPVTPSGDSLSDKAAKEIGENLAEEMLGGIDIEYAEEGSGETVAWPTKIPGDVPVFKYGKIDATLAAPGGGEGDVAIQFREVEEGAYDKYEQDLKNAGWEIVTDSAWEDEHISATKGDVSIDVDVDPMGENTAFLYYLVTQPQ